MKKLVVASAMAVFLSSMAVHAQSTNSWDFNTEGDTEGWVVGIHIDGLTATNGVLTASAYTGGDPGIQFSGTNSIPVAGEYWDTLQIRIRQLASPGGAPVTFNSGGTIAVVNWEIINGGIGTGSLWTMTNEPNQWVVAELDISSIGTNDLWFVRLDPPGGVGDGFEIDYIRYITNTNAPPPPVYKKNWEFNTPGDTEGWAGNVNNVKIATAVGSSESVLTADDFSAADPQLYNNTEPALLEPGLFWSAAECRMRLTSGGVAIPWETADLALFGSLLIPGTDWDVRDGGGNGWIIARFNLEALGSGTLPSMRFDPFGAANGKGFELDYIRLETRSTPPLPAAPAQLVHSWEFNTPGNTEDVTTRNDGIIVGLTAATDISGIEGVLTSADITGVDPWLFYNDGNANPALSITPPGPWTTLEMRIRTLNNNPGAPGVASIPFASGGTLFQMNPWTGPQLLTATSATTDTNNNWLVVTYDISYLGLGSLDGFRLDPTGNDETLNFEVDYIRVYSQGTSYDAWVQSLYGVPAVDAGELDDPDGDSYNNLYEYALGGNPTNPAIHGLAESGSVEMGGTNYFEYVHARRIGFNTGVTYNLQQKDALNIGSWISIGNAAVVGTAKLNDDYEAVTNRIEAANSKQFFNLEVTGQ